MDNQKKLAKHILQLHQLVGEYAVAKSKLVAKYETISDDDFEFEEFVEWVENRQIIDGD
jgi:hypothetical protein